MTSPKVTYPNKKDVNFKVKNISNADMTDSNSTYFEKHYRENMDINDFKTQTGTGCIYHGEAGCGKTTKLCKMVLKAESPIILSFTNTAVENIKERLRNICDKNRREDLSGICHTFDSCDWHGRDISDLVGRTIFIEEHSMVPNKWMTKIYKACSKYCNTVYLFGDKNQCDPVEGHSQLHYNYFTSKTIMDMCPERVKLEYIEGCSRYDTKTPDMLTKFLKTGKIQPEFPAIGRYYKNICISIKREEQLQKFAAMSLSKTKSATW